MMQNMNVDLKETPPFNNNEWIPYTFGEAIHIDWEYRKVKKWYVFDYGNNDYRIFKDDTDCAVPCVFEGNKKECEKWIEEHTKTWLKITLNEKRKSSTEYTCTELDMYELGCENGIVEVCKKILEEIEEKLPFYIDTGRNHLLKDIKSIIEDLGVNID